MEIESQNKALFLNHEDDKEKLELISGTQFVKKGVKISG